MACIIVGPGPDEGRYIILSEQDTVVGRDPDAHLSLHDASASRQHLQLCFEPDARAHIATDLGSSNGTWLNGRRLDAGATLAEGDELLVGATRLFFTEDEPIDDEDARRIVRSLAERPTQQG